MSEVYVEDYKDKVTPDTYNLLLVAEKESCNFGKKSITVPFLALAMVRAGAGFKVSETKYRLLLSADTHQLEKLPISLLLIECLQLASQESQKFRATPIIDLGALMLGFLSLSRGPQLEIFFQAFNLNRLSLYKSVQKEYLLKNFNSCVDINHKLNLLLEYINLTNEVFLDKLQGVLKHESS